MSFRLGRVIALVVAVPVLLAGLAAGAIALMPLDSLRAPLERAVSRTLGREVHVAGALHASLYPEIGVSAGDVSIANISGGQARVFAHVGTMAVGAKLIPLFSREIAITRLTLEDPEIHLEVDKAGSGNWNFHFASSSSKSSRQSRLSIAGLKISNGAISYFDARTGKTKTLSAANVSLSLAALDQPAIFDIDALYNGEKLTATGQIDSPDSYTKKMPTKVLIDLKSRLFALHFNGAVVGATQNEGTFELSGPSLRELVKGAGAGEFKTKGMGAFSIAGAVSTKDSVYALKGAKASLDDMHATVDMAVDMKGTNPALKGTIALDRLNLANYMVSGKPAASSGWSAAPISVKALKDADADIGVSVGTLTLGAFEISHGAMHVVLHDGVLAVDVAHAGIFGGSASGRLGVDANGPVPGFSLKSDVSGVALKALLQSAMKIDRLEGTGFLAMDVAGRGASQKAIVGSLHGTASVTAKNGAIRGVDLAAVARTFQNVLSGALGGATSEKASTDFAEAGGKFTIANGIMHNTDFHLLNPFVRVTGSGDIDLGQRTLNFRVEPKLAMTREGQGGSQNAAGLGIPFLVSGPWTKLSYKPDMKAMPGMLLDQVKNGGGSLGGLLNNALGSKKASGTTTPQKSPGFDLGGLLGR